MENAATQRKTLLAEKKSTPILQISKHREISRCIAELTEELEELHSEKVQLLQSLGYAEDAGVDEMREDVATMEALLMKLGQQEQEYRTEYDNALKKYSRLKEKAAKFGTDELMSERLAIRPSKERSAVSRMQSVYGNKYQPLMMYDSKQHIYDMLGEKAEIQSVQEKLRQKPQEKRPLPQRQIKDKGQER